MIAGQRETEREINGFCMHGCVRPPPPCRRRTSLPPLSVVTIGVLPSHVAAVYFLSRTAHHRHIRPTAAAGKELAGKI
ncbi:hypothetical protein LXL04_024221 [Taraxacum kok-saghyz]